MDILNLFHVQEMIAVVTGGGIGFMIAKALVSAGASKVYILGRRKDKLELAAAQHESLIPLQCDITSKESLQAAVDTIAKDVGFINLLVANSGILGPTSSFVPGLGVQELRKNMFEDTAMEEFAQTFHVNTTATYFSMFAFLELLDAGNKNALDGGFGKPLGEGSKVPSIQSQVIITSSVGAFLLFPSEMANTIIESRDPSTESVDDPNFIPARRFGGEEEMSGTILYLASRAGSFCNGLILANDGGRLGVTMSTY
ncbi:short-chain dehydrogenase [Alternaria alternata]|nr:short-chain dehydrogenase [Alternaria alternata]